MENDWIPKKLWKPVHGKRNRGRTRTKWTDVIQRDLMNLGFGWSVEEAEVAAQDALFG